MTNRRKAIQLMATAAASSASIYAMGKSGHNKPEDKSMKLKGNITHSVCRWTYSFLTLEELCKVANDIGLKAIDLIGPKEWDVLKKNGLDSSMCNGAEITLTEGWNDPQYHAVEGLKKIMGLAEKKGVVIQMELFNSKVDHKDYMADKSAWGIDLCKRLGSENFKLLYDIYHMQINEGDIIHTINEGHQYFGHYHTAGVPGRHELDDKQELNYPAIMAAIVETGYKGYVAHEFIPVAQDKIASLRQAVNVCDV